LHKHIADLRAHYAAKVAHVNAKTYVSNTRVGGVVAYQCKGQKQTPKQEHYTTRLPHKTRSAALFYFFSTHSTQAPS